MTKNTDLNKYYVKGMHCRSCELLIEKRLQENENIKSVKASTSKGTVDIEYKNRAPSISDLNKTFEKDNYVFSTQPVTKDDKSNNLTLSMSIALLIISIFIIINNLGLASNLFGISSPTSLPTFILFGLFAGFSTCAALVGGIILSMSKQWADIHLKSDSKQVNAPPQIFFNVGRVIGFAFFGALLGGIGSLINLSLKIGPLAIISISLVMIITALQMVGIKFANNVRIGFPKSISKLVVDENNFKSRYMPFLMGALTFFIPCGFTITAQGFALISGNAVQGGLIMLMFSLGTLPSLLIIGFSGQKLSKKPGISYIYMKVAGFLILFFALFNINSQLAVLGTRNIDDFVRAIKNVTVTKESNANIEDGLPPIVDGKQVIRMDASARGYTPSYFKVRVGVPVRWEIADIGTSGCTNAVISRSFFKDEIPLTPGQTSIKEFTPEFVGAYKFSCWMGMVSGVIEVVDYGK